MVGALHTHRWPTDPYAPTLCMNPGHRIFRKEFYPSIRLESFLLGPLIVPGGNACALGLILGFPFIVILCRSVLDLSRIPSPLFLSFIPYCQGAHLSVTFRGRVDGF